MRDTDAEIHTNNFALVFCEGRESAFDFKREGFLHESVVGCRGVLVWEDVDEVDILVGDERGVDGYMAARDAEDRLDFIFRDVEEFGELFFRRRAFEFLLEFGDFLFEFVECAKLVGGKPDDARVFGDGLKNGLTDPPDSIRYEFEATSFVETLSSLYEADITFVDKVGEAEALILVLLSHGDHEAEVGFGEAVECGLVAGLDALSELYLLLRGEEFLAADVLKVFVERLDVAVSDRMCNL